MSKTIGLIVVAVLIIGGILAYINSQGESNQISMSQQQGKQIDESNPVETTQQSSAVTINFYNPISKTQVSFDEQTYSVMKETSSMSYADFFVEGSWVKQNTIDSAQSGDNAKYISKLEDLITSKGFKIQKFTQLDGNELVSNYYFFDLGNDETLFVQASEDSEDQQIVNEIINSITF